MRAARLCRNASREQELRAFEGPRDESCKLCRNASREQEQRAFEAPEMKAAQLCRNACGDQKRRASEAPEMRAAQLQCDASKKQPRRDTQLQHSASQQQQRTAFEDPRDLQQPLHAPSALYPAQDKEIPLSHGHSTTTIVFNLPRELPWYHDCFWFCLMCALPFCQESFPGITIASGSV